MGFYSIPFLSVTYTVRAHRTHTQSSYTAKGVEAGGGEGSSTEQSQGGIMAQGAIGSIAPRDTGGEKGESFVSFHGMPNRGRWEGRRRRRRKVGGGGRGGNYLFAVVVGRRRRRGERERRTEGLGRVLRWLTQASPSSVLGRRRSGILWAIGAGGRAKPRNPGRRTVSRDPF